MAEAIDSIAAASKSLPRSDELAEMRAPVDEHFFRRDNLTAIEFVFKTQKSLQGPIRAVADVFARNLIDAHITAGSTWICMRRSAWRSLLNSAMAFDIGKYGWEWYDQKNAPELQNQLIESMASPPEFKGQTEGLAEYIAIHELSDFLTNRVGRNCASTVLLQCSVLVWSALEIVASDVFEAVLNNKPEASNRLLEDSRTQKFYVAKDIAALLKDYSYDLSKHMGTVLLNLCRLDDLTRIRRVYDVLLDNATLRNCLGDDRLWHLFKSRNLITHRAAVVDELFRTSTGLDVRVGDSIRINPAQFEEYMVLVGRAGVEILTAASQFISS